MATGMRWVPAATPNRTPTATTSFHLRSRMARIPRARAQSATILPT